MQLCDSKIKKSIINIYCRRQIRSTTDAFSSPKSKCCLQSILWQKIVVIIVNSSTMIKTKLLPLSSTTYGRMEKKILSCPNQKRFGKILIDQDNWSIANEVSKSLFFFQSDYYTYMILQKDLWDTPCSIVTQTLRFLLHNSSSENKSIIVDLRNDTLTIRDYMYVVVLVLEPTTNQLFMKIRKI